MLIARCFLKLLFLWVLCGAWERCQAKDPPSHPSSPHSTDAEAAEFQRPNVLFILADDLGWADTTLYGHTKFYRTPNIERLAKTG